MAQLTNRLTAKQVENLKVSGRYPDGRGLYFHLDDKGGRSWVFRYKFDKRERNMGLGPARDVSLARARDLAAEARAHLAEGRDPLEARKEAAAAANRAKAEAERAKASRRTFGDIADELIRSMSPAWRNPKHRQQWKNTLATYGKRLRTVAIADVDTETVLEVLRPIWTAKPETASRVRGRIERVLDYARAQGMRSGENPARWRGHLDQILPPRAKLTRGHHAALDYKAVAPFMRRLRDRDAVAARALEFTILTAARSGEVLRARWTEFDLEAKIWTIPGTRMKAGREHRVPLAEAALAVLELMKPLSRGTYVFPSQKPKGRADTPLSVMAMEMLLRRMDAGAITVHGFRSSFRDWAAEETNFANIVAEMALAHVVRDGVEAAYRRGDLFDKRRKLMEAWEGYCAKTPKLKSVGEQ